MSLSIEVARSPRAGAASSEDELVERDQALDVLYPPLGVLLTIDEYTDALYANVLTFEGNSLSADARTTVQEPIFLECSQHCLKICQVHLFCLRGIVN